MNRKGHTSETAVVSIYCGPDYEPTGSSQLETELIFRMTCNPYAHLAIDVIGSAAEYRELAAALIRAAEYREAQEAKRLPQDDGA